MSIPAEGLAQLASIVCPTSVFGGWSLLFASFTGSQFYMAKLACKQRRSNICLPTSKNVFDSVLVNVQNAEQEMFEKFGGGKTSASKDMLFTLSHVRQTLKSKNMNFILQYRNLLGHNFPLNVFQTLSTMK